MKKSAKKTDAGAALSSASSGKAPRRQSRSHRYKFAFIVPAYAGKRNANNERHTAGVMALGRCIDSILQQTDPNCRIIVVNDGASLEMRELIQEFSTFKPQHSDTLIPITYMQAPYRGQRGGHDSINMALSVLEDDCDFVTFLNADNTIRPEYIEKMYNAEADVLLCMVKMNDIPGTVLTGQSFTRGYIDRLNYSIRASIARNIRHKLHLSADCDYVIDATQMMENPFHVVEEILAEHN